MTNSPAATIAELTPTRVAIRYEIRDAQTGAPRTTGETRHCAFDSRRQRPVAIQRALPALYALFLQLRQTAAEGEASKLLNK